MKYQANPVIVDAYVIIRVSPIDPEGGMTVFTEDGQVRIANYIPIPKDGDYWAIPKDGDYWVIQSDGYEYVSPKAVFERKYSSL